MPPRLRAHSIAAADPSAAARHTAASLLGDVPRTRPLLLAVADWGAHPGLRPAPWTLEGVRRAIGDAELSARALTLGETSVHGSLSPWLSARGLPEADERDPITLHPAGSRRAWRVPRGLVGSALCLVVPCVHRQPPGRNPRPRWWGPLGVALAALAERWGGPPTRDHVDQAAHQLGELFCHVSVVVDASWWAPLSAEDQGAPLLLAPERVLGLRLAAPVTATEAIEPRQADAWIGQQLGLPLRRREPPVLEGPAAHAPWPRMPRGPAASRKGPGLAGQAVAALWRRNDRPGSRRAALPPAVPGALASLWDEYEPARPA